MTFPLPLLPAYHRIATTLCRTRDVTAAVIPVGLVLMWLTGDGLPARLATAVTLAAVLLHVAVGIIGLAAGVHARVDTDGRWLRLSGVSPDFVAATKATTTRPPSEPALDRAGPVRWFATPRRSSEATGES